MIRDLDFDGALARIAPVHHRWVDEVVPRAVPPHRYATYSPLYAWMFTYEKSLKKKLEAALSRPLGRLERRLFGPDGVISEGLSNAFLHGHRRQTELTITVECAVGVGGVAVAIRDQGSGFDVNAALQKLRRGGGYFHVAGNGLRTFAAATDIEVGFANGGRMLILLVPLPGAGNAPVDPPCPGRS